MQTLHTPATSLKEKQRKEREELILQAAEEVFQLGEDFSREDQIKNLRRVYFNGIIKHEEK